MKINNINSNQQSFGMALKAPRLKGATAEEVQGFLRALPHLQAMGKEQDVEVSIVLFAKKHREDAKIYSNSLLGKVLHYCHGGEYNPESFGEAYKVVVSKPNRSFLGKMMAFFHDFSAKTAVSENVHYETNPECAGSILANTATRAQNAYLKQG